MHRYAWVQLKEIVDHTSRLLQEEDDEFWCTFLERFVRLVYLRGGAWYIRAKTPLFANALKSTRESTTLGPEVVDSRACLVVVYVLHVCVLCLNRVILDAVLVHLIF